MNYEETARQLIEGSRAINKMREEIELLVPMVISMLPKPESDCYLEELEHTFESEAARWILSVRTGRHSGRSVRAQCFLPEKPGGPKTRLVYSNGFGFDRRDVQAIHGSLPLFLKGIMDNFPTANKEWNVFIEAAKKGVL